MVKSFSSALTAAKNEDHSGNPLVWLYRVRRDATPANDLFLANYHEDVLYDLGDGGGVRTFAKSSFLLNEVGEQRGSLAEVDVTITNVDRTAVGFLEAGEIIDRRVDIFLVSLADLATVGHHDTLSYVVRSATAGEEGVTFRLGQFPYFSFMFPADRYLRDRCRFIYEGGTNPTVDGRCAAVSANETCDKSFESAAGCKGNDNQDRFGGFPYLLVGPHPLVP